MRLINTTTFELTDFHTAPYDMYAILSHRWEDEEITFADFQARRFHDEDGKPRQGWKKIKKFCDLAYRKNIRWAWVDTCCIDKASSAELSEAINSMYNWYRSARICIAYLSDVYGNVRIFESSIWFTRGWTLQELLAPVKLEFYNMVWKFLGSRQSLSELTSKATAIPTSLLTDAGSPEPDKFCVAQRFSWASNRQVTRGEDRAYCLLGLFKVNMPLLYGEGGARAFRRFQLEIIKDSSDESIFAWRHDTTIPTILAPHERYFSQSGDVQACRDSSDSYEPYSMTNKGLKMQKKLYPLSKKNCNKIYPLRDLPNDEQWLALLNCERYGLRLALLLDPSKSSHKKSRLYRCVGIYEPSGDLSAGVVQDIFIEAPNFDDNRADEMNRGGEMQLRGEEPYIDSPTLYLDRIRKDIKAEIKILHPATAFDSDAQKILDFDIMKRYVIDSSSGQARAELAFVTRGVGPSGSDYGVSFEQRMQEIGFSQDKISEFLHRLKRVFFLE